MVDAMEPLRVSWRLAMPWAPPNYGLHLDGLLAWAAVQEARAVGRAFSAFEEVIERLPLARHETDAGWCWKASLVTPSIALAPERRYITARTPVFDLAAFESEQRAAMLALNPNAKLRHAGAVNTASGFFKNAAFYVSLQHVTELEAWCIGSREHITNLLRHVTHVGTKGRMGFGAVRLISDLQGYTRPDYSVDPAPEASERWCYRLMPEQRDDYIPVQSRIQPPYWDGVGAQLAWRPASFA
jgi:CRISPR type IV-associated protein Csf3